MKLELKLPVTPFIINQHFGADNACYNPTTKEVITRTTPTCVAPFVSLYAASGMKGHNGVDLWASHGLPLYASLEGFVEEVEADTNRGLGLGIISNKKYEVAGGEYNIKMRYWHLKAFNVVKGQEVKAGDLIGWCDNTGFSSGDHLHLEMKPVEKNSSGKWYNILQNNGYYGSVDCLPHFVVDAPIVEQPFTTTLRYGMINNTEVKRLQVVLKRLGYFPPEQEPTGNYFGVTMNAVYQMQLETCDLTWYEKNVLRGSIFGEKSRLAINNLIK